MKGWLGREAAQPDNHAEWEWNQIPAFWLQFDRTGLNSG